MRHVAALVVTLAASVAGVSVETDSDGQAVLSPDASKASAASKKLLRAEHALKAKSKKQNPGQEATCNHRSP